MATEWKYFLLSKVNRYTKEQSPFQLRKKGEKKNHPENRQ